MMEYLTPPSLFPCQEFPCQILIWTRPLRPYLNWEIIIYFEFVRWRAPGMYVVCPADCIATLRSLVGESAEIAEMIKRTRMARMSLRNLCPAEMFRRTRMTGVVIWVA